MDYSVKIYLITMAGCGILMAYGQFYPPEKKTGKAILLGLFICLITWGLLETWWDANERELERGRAQIWLGQSIVQSAQQDQRAQQQQETLISLLKIVTTPSRQPSFDAKAIARELANIRADETPALKHKVQALANEILVFVYQRQQKAPYYPVRVITETDKKQLQVALPYAQETATLAKEKFSTRISELRNELRKQGLYMPRAAPPSEEFYANELMRLGLMLVEFSEQM